MPEVSKSPKEIASLFGEDIRHLENNLFRVKISKVELAPQGVEVEGGAIKFGNPRWHINPSGKMTAHGLTDVENNGREKAEILKLDIQEDGLENPLRLRLTDDNRLEIVNGERRYRQIASLRHENALCYDPATGKTVPAKELYEWVDCRINYMDDLTALEYSIRPNESGEPIGEAALIHVVKVMRETGFDDNTIRRKTGNKSVTWLRETDKLLALDHETLEAYDHGKINRTVALDLCGIQDVSDRSQRLASLLESATQRLADYNHRLAKDLEKAEDAAEIAEAIVTESELLGNEDDVVVAQENYRKAQTRAKKKRDAAERAATRQPQATTKDLRATVATDSDSEDPGNKPLTASKLERYWAADLTDIVRQKGKDADGVDLEIDLEDARLLKMTVDAILNGRREPDGKTPISVAKLLKQHLRNKEKREQTQE